MKLVDSSCIISVFNEIKKPFIIMNWMKRDYDFVVAELNALKRDWEVKRWKKNPSIGARQFGLR
jgi:hypothetical protein